MKRLFGVAAVVVAGAVWVARTGDPQVEAVTLSCSAGFPDLEAVGTVTNLSDEPLDLTARIVLHSADRDRRYEGPVFPQPLPPGRSGEFRVSGELPQGAYSSAQLECVIDSFRDADGGKVKHVESEAGIDGTMEPPEPPSGPAAPQARPNFPTGG